MPESTDPLLRPRRFYKAAGAAPAQAGGWAVQLDGRAPRSPRGHALVVPTEALARLIAAEWEAQGASVDLPTMLATRLAYTTLDGVAHTRDKVAEGVAEYAQSDLVCYLAEHPAALVARQRAAWTPLLDWAREALDLPLTPVSGIMHRDQPADTGARVKALALVLDDFALAGLSHAVGLTGSAVLALAMLRGRLSGPAAFAASRVDEAFQEEQWGVDAEAAARTERLAAEAQMLDAWFAALR